MNLTIFRQWAVVDAVWCLIRIQMTQWAIDALVRCLMVQNVMTMWECATLNVLTGQTNVNAFLQQWSECHGLTHGPINVLGVKHIFTGGQNTQQTAMNNEFGRIWWWRRETVTNVNQRLFFDASCGRLQWILALEEARPGRIQPILVLNIIKYNRY